MRKFNTTFSIFMLILAVVIIVMVYQPFAIEVSFAFPILLIIGILIPLLTSRVWHFSISLNLLLIETLFFIVCIVTDRFSAPLPYYLIQGLILGISTAAASATGKSMNDFTDEYSKVASILEVQSILTVSKVRPLIESEFARGTRYNYPITLILFEGVPEDRLKFDSSVSTISDLFKEQITANRLAKFLQSKSRVTDILVRIDDENEFLLICPGINEESAQLLINRLKAEDHLAVDFTHRLYSFPDDVRSFDAVLELIHENKREND